MRRVEGGVLRAGQLVVWGDGVDSVSLSGGGARRIGEGSYDRGGCAFGGGLLLNESAQAGETLGRAVFLALPSGQIQVADTHASFRDCLEAKLFGRLGVLVTHLQMQLRFYERPARKGDRWPYREIYSIYTASAQAGLALMDVDGDGRDDILHGNYWVQSPTEFDLSWRIFAFNNWWDTPRSAMLRIAVSAGDVVAAESAAAPARVARFSRPGDPKQFWRESPVEIAGGIAQPAVIAVHGGWIMLGEDNGEGSRLLAVKNGAASVLGTSRGYLGIWPEHSLALTRESIQRYRLK